MRRLILLLCLMIAFVASPVSASAQTTTYTGTIKDLSLNVVTSGQVTFTLAPSVDTTIPGLGRFTPTTIACNINTDGSLSGYVAGVVSGACIVASNTAISPSGTSYRICIQPYGITPGSCFYDYALQATKDITTIAPTLQTGPVNYNGVPGPPLNVTGAWSSSYVYKLGDVAIASGVAYVSLAAANLNNAPASSPTFWNTLQSFTNLPVTAPSVNYVVWADGQAGANEGAKINAAFASQAGTASVPTPSVVVQLSPNQTYSYSTPIIIPSATVSPYVYTPALDCQGATLIYTGSGDAITVLAENSNGFTGYITNCNIQNASGNTASTNGVHQYSRIGFGYFGNHFIGFNNPTSSGVLIDNTATTWGGYNERTRFVNNTFDFNTKQQRFLGSDGGTATNSFARTVVINSEYGMNSGQTGMSIEGLTNSGSNQADMYNAYIDIRGNGGVTNSPALSVSNGADLRTSVLNMGFESVSSLIYIADTASAVIVNNGVTDGNGAPNFLCSGCTSDQITIGGSGFIAQSTPFTNGVKQSLNSKFCVIVGPVCGNDVRFGLPDNGYLYGYWQIYKRTTTDNSDPEVDAAPSSGNMQVNVAFCEHKGCGFGPGYGASATTGGATEPTNPIEVNAGAFHVDTAGNVTGASVATPSFVSGATYRTASNCAPSLVTVAASACGSAASGYTLIFPGYATAGVNTTAVTANSRILLTITTALGAPPANLSTLGAPIITAQNPGNGFTVGTTSSAQPTTNPLVMNWLIIN